MNEFKNNEMFEKIIKDFFQNLPITKIQTRSPKFLKDHPEIDEYLKEYLKHYPNWETEKHILYKIVLNMELPKCLECGKELKFSKRNRKFCSLKCCNSNEEFLKKKEETVLNKYGVKNINQSEFIKNKSKNTRKQNEQNDELYWKKREEKGVQTKIQKYGSLKNAYDIKNQHRKQTCLQKYGTEYACQNENVKNKIKQTLIKHYGSLTEYYKIQKQKAIDTIINKYNTNNISLKRGWNKIIQKWKDYIIPLFTFEQYFRI